MTNIQLINGDCLEEMKKLPDNSVDAVVSDPPYGLSFMGKRWDYDVPSQEIWVECLRVLKPGGYLLAFAGTRTQHRMAVRIEDVGFEIRDMIAWVYGSGFPKSLNIGKAVDKLQGNEREDCGIKTYAGPSGNNRNFGVGNDDEGSDKRKLTKGTSEWEGWGTALKPALEPITVARKPLSEKTVAENCLKWGTGGINIDGCRVGTEENLGRDNNARTEGTSYVVQKEDLYIDNSKGLGRFPANLIHDGSDEVVSLFPTSNVKGSAIRKNKVNPYGGERTWSVSDTPAQDTVGYADSGSASRFFYCAKASKSERNKGCEELEDKRGGSMEANITDKMQLGGASLKGEHKEIQKTKNNHPTVKPIALMEYLVKLVSREGTTILDPFMGSGTTGIACRNLNRNFIGIERDVDYMEIATKRIYD